jgi:hypothetical protein
MTETELRAVIDQYPLLGASGFHCGHPAGRRRVGCTNLACGKPVEWLVEDRAALVTPRSVVVMLAVAEVINPCRRTKRATDDSPGSYQLKHSVEKVLTNHPVARGYVSNGQLIVAAVACGFPVRQDSPNSPNAAIGMYQADARGLRRQD